MKTLSGCAFIACALFLCLSFHTPAISDAQVQVNIGLPLPPLFIPALPPLLPIPGAYVYYPPEVELDIFFYHDRWYRPYGGKWYRARHHNGPWQVISHSRVPHAVIGIPKAYRVVHHHYKPVPYNKVKNTHWYWEKHRHWDRDKHEEHSSYRVEKRRQDDDRKPHQSKHDDHKHKD